MFKFIVIFSLTTEKAEFYTEVKEIFPVFSVNCPDNSVVIIFSFTTEKAEVYSAFKEIVSVFSVNCPDNSVVIKYFIIIILQLIQTGSKMILLIYYQIDLLTIPSSNS